MKSIIEEVELAKAMYGYNGCECTVPTEEELYPQEICDCGERKRIQDLFCNRCQKSIIDHFKHFMKEAFNREELEYLNEVLEGEYLPDYILGKE